MRLLLLTGLLMTVIAVTEIAQDKANLTDEEKIQGTWTFVSGASNGKPVAENKIKDSVVVIGKDTIYVRDANNKTTWEVSYRIDATKKPKGIDMQLKAGELKEKKTEGIYQIDGDSLKLCYALPGEARPTSFTGKEGGKINSFVLKRSK